MGPHERERTSVGICSGQQNTESSSRSPPPAIMGDPVARARGRGEAPRCRRRRRACRQDASSGSVLLCLEIALAEPPQSGAEPSQDSCQMDAPAGGCL